MVIAKRSQKHFSRQWERTGDLNGHVEEMFTGHNIVKIFGRQNEAIAVFDKENVGLYEASFKAQFISGIIMPATFFVSNLNYVAVCVLGGLRVASGTMSLGDVTAFIQYVQQFGSPSPRLPAWPTYCSRRWRPPSGSSTCLTRSRSRPTPLGPATSRSRRATSC